jgi:hypothetical protein
MTRDDILEHLQPALDELVDRIAAMLPGLVRSELVATLGKLTGEAAPAKARVPREPKPKKSTKAITPKSGRKPNSCRKCGATGFTAATCGKTHNVASAKADTSPAVSPPPERESRPLLCHRGGRPCAPRRAVTPMFLYTRSSASASEVT